jgi:hypothetical protein
MKKKRLNESLESTLEKSYSMFVFAMNAGSLGKSISQDLMDSFAS